MVKTRRSGENGEVEDGIVPPLDPCSISDEKASVTSQRELRSAQLQVTRKLPRWPTKYTRRRRPIRMPRIMFPESDTEPEKYSRRSRPMRVFFAAEDAGSANGSVRIKHNRAPRKNYMEDSEDKPIQQNVRRSCRKRKLLHHNFNESWITNELKVRGYPGLYGLQGSSSSDEFYMEHQSRNSEQTIPQNHIPVVTDEDTQSGRRRRTSARFTNTNKIKFNVSDSENERNQTVIESKPVMNNKDEGMDTEEQEPPPNEDGPQDNNDNDSKTQKPPPRLTRGRCRRQLLPKKEDFIPQDDTGSESSSSESDCGLTGPVRRSNRTRKQPAFIEIAPRQTRNRANKFTLRQKKYSLRERKPKKLLRRNTIRSQSPSTTSSSSSSSDTEEDLNVSVKERKNKGRQKSKSSKSSDDKTDRALRDIQPVEVDGSVRFTSVGGLEDHIKCLREMVLFPLMYPEVFDKFHSRPPKGVLFHGPPGTGKTLLARALANECTIVGGRKVSFFMRKGADCLKKWVGESERHLKLLFQQANKMKPSIIFFDEIDALAPVRSVRQEQVHTSVVGTLLAEMDGLCDRGEVVVIGATNRLDAVDGALRRAGRFDRELYFPAPHPAARRDILHIYTHHWTPPPPPHVIQRIADITTGYGGSDIKALCSEAVLKALKRTYPQVYESEQALLIDAKNVVVLEEDLISGVAAVKAAGGRALPDPARPLPPRLHPLLYPQLREVQRLLRHLYVPPAQTDTTNGVTGSSVCPSSLLVCGGGARWVCGAVCGALERCAVRELSLTTLHAALTFTHEQALISVMNEARRCDRGCIIYMPDVTSLWDMLGVHGTQLLLHMWEGRFAGEHTLLLATTHLAYEDVPQQIRCLFPPHKGCVYSLPPPTSGEVTDFLRPLVITAPSTPPLQHGEEAPPPLPLAPPPPPPMESAEDAARRKRKEDYKLRELRIFLRDICRKLASNRRFYKFTKPVDLEEVTDYLDIVKEPMDLETMMTKVDMHKYNCAKEFLDDIDLICANALEYNPDRTSSDKQIRHEACSLRDHAHALIDVEMDSDFEIECQEIARKRGEQGVNSDPDLPHFIYTTSNLQHSLRTTLNDTKEPETPNGDKSETHSAKRKRKRISTWSKGFVKRHKTTHKTYTPKDPNIPITDEESKENKPVTSTPLPNGDRGESSNSDDDLPLRTPTHTNDEDTTLTHSPTKSNDKTPTKTSPKKRNRESTSDKSAEGEQVIINKTELENLLYKNVKALRTIGIEALIELYDQLNIIVQSYSNKYDRTKLPHEMATVINRYIQHLGKK